MDRPQANRSAAGPQPTEPQPKGWRRLAARFGFGGLIFFTLKGLLWLLIPALLGYSCM